MTTQCLLRSTKEGTAQTFMMMTTMINFVVEACSRMNFYVLHRCTKPRQHFAISVSVLIFGYHY